MCQRVANDDSFECGIPSCPACGRGGEAASVGETLSEPGDVVAVAVDSPRGLARTEDADCHLPDQVFHLSQR
ncbi:hypothetical protein A6A27_00815 [Micromonospora sp. CB01531]|nr:hypothetical protein A6A27_00815 [Micromonospora sp. CB01531]